jgi:pilus assembly protein FimV
MLPVVAAAAGLGQMKVASGIGEPFRATIDLLYSTSTELSTLKASLASEEAHLAQGIEITADQKSIKINVGNDASGKKVFKLSSNQPISEPFIDMLVVLEWGNGRVIRQYTTLLYPPEDKREVSKPTPPATNSFDNTSVNNSTSNIKKSGAPKATELAKRTTTKEHLTRSGDTLSKIARRMRPDGVSLDRILVALFEANPEAFVDSNMNRLKVGKILQAPSGEALSAVTRKKAVKEIKLQTADWNKYRNKLAAAIATRTPAASNEGAQSSSGKIKSAATDQSAPKSKTPKDVVKISTDGADAKDASMQAKVTALQEEVGASEKGLKEAKERTAALGRQIADMQKQIADMQKLLTLKNDALLDAQEKSAKTAETKVVETKSGDVGKEATSLLDSVVGMFKQLDKIILGVVALLIALLLVCWLYLRNKPSKKLEGFEQDIMTSGSWKANTVFGDTASGNINMGDTSKVLDASDFSDSSLAKEADLNFLDSGSDAAESAFSGVADATTGDVFDVDKSALEIANVVEQAYMVDLSSISLDISDDGDNTPAKTAEADEVEAEPDSLTPAFEGVETKLELVAAYIDMKDKDGAKELLEEVLKEGNLSQRKRADQMLSYLA